MQQELAPIVLFVYNRPEHTLQTLEGLKRNSLADKSILFIYSDGPKNNALTTDTEKIKKVREIINSQKWCKEVIIRESSINKGLANSVINGVSEIINQYNKVIVLEDDILISKEFLKYMNQALNLYSNQHQIVQISGFYPNSPNEMGENSCFFLPITSTWGWATWKDRWQNVDFSPEDYSILKGNSDLKRRFDLGNIYPYSQMLIDQMELKNISSWGIRFWWDSFKKNKLVLYPDKSLIQNIGFDGSGIHCNDSDFYDMDFDQDYEIKNFPTKIMVDLRKYKKYKDFFKKQTSISGFNRLKSVLSKISKTIFNKLKIRVDHDLSSGN